MLKKYQLKNGMNVLLVESHKSPVISVQMWVRTGSADEMKGEEGISHFIEHLVFKGSRQYKVGEIAAAVEGAGGEINAYTSFDQTVFYVTISKQFENVGLNVISEMMGFPSFDPVEIDNEREVVIEEIKRSLDSLSRRTSRLLFSSVYKNHPYGIPVIGYEENVRNFTPAEIYNYYSGRYNPKTMTLVVVGDFDPKGIKPKIAEHFGAFEPKKLRPSKRKKLIPQKTPRIVVEGSSFEEGMCHAVWRAPKADHKDIPALEVLALVLGQGESSRLFRRLRLEDACVHSVGSSLFSSKEPGFFAVSSSLNPDNFSKFLAGLMDELENILTTPVAAVELEKALVNLGSEQFYSMETVDGLARKYGHYEDLFRDPSYFNEFLKQVQTVTPQDVLRVARKYMKTSAMTFVAMVPEADREASQSQIKLFIKNFRKLTEKKPSRISATQPSRRRKVKLNWKSPVEPRRDLEKIRLPSGATLVVRPNFDTPVVSMRMACLGGSRMEAPGERGATELLSRVWTAGAGRWNEKELNERMDAVAAGISAFGGRHTIGLGLTALKLFWESAFDVLLTTLRDPHFPEAVIDRETKSMADHIRLRKDNPAQICILNFMKKLFGDHPYGWDPFGDENTLKTLNQKTLRRLWSETVSPSGLVAVVSGAITRQEVEARLNAAWSDWKVERSPAPQHDPVYPKESQVVFEPSQKEQSHIVFGFPGLKINESEKYTLQIMQSVLAGQGGRLFVELRDKASLAYSVAPLRMDALEGGYFGAYIGCTPSKSKTAIRMLQDEFFKLRESLITNEELERARRYLIGRHDIELQRNSNISNSVLFDEIYGLPFDETFHFAERVKAVTREDVRSVAERLFSQPHVLSVVGPENPA